MILTAEQAFEISQEGAIREKKKMKKRDAKEFHLVMKKIRQIARRGRTDNYFNFHIISYPTVDKLDKLGYKIKYRTAGINISWEDARDSVTGREGEVSA